MPPFEALYGRRCRSLTCWEQVGDRRIYGIDLTQEIAEKIKIIRKSIKIAQCRQKAYVDYHCRLLEFSVSGKVFLKVSPIKGVLCINRKNKLDS